MIRLGILLSGKGRGSNMQALIDEGLQLAADDGPQPLLAPGDARRLTQLAQQFHSLSCF